MAKRKPLVSVFCLTFNQKDYIRECLDGILSQQVDFTYEILINDDASTDGTIEILEEYRSKYPDIIRLVLHDENQFSQGKRSFILRYLIPLARGRYFAICEGDDYWCDTNKLQDQVNFMENNVDCALCFHPVRIRTEGSEEERVYPGSVEDISIDKLLQENFIHTNSVMYKRQKYEDASLDVMPADWYLHLYHAQFGKIGLINKVMSVYRQHGESMWASIRNNEEVFWQKFGTLHIVFFIRILEMYGEQNKRREAIENNIISISKKIHKFAPDANDVIRLAASTVPQLGVVLISEVDRLDRALSNAQQEISEKNESIHQLKTTETNLKKEIVLLKSSKFWKLRNRVVSILGGKKV